MSLPGAAVVIPAWNAAASLRATVLSALAQTLPPEEVVVVDDGSPDDVQGAVEGLAVRCVRRENGGPGAARNTGIACTKAPLVAFLDADDLWDPDKLEAQASLLAARPEAVAVCCDAWVEEPGREPRLFSAGRTLPPVVTVEDLLLANTIPAFTVVARREALEAVGGFDEDRRLMAVEDYDLWIRLAELGPFLRVTRPLGTYRKRPGSLGGAVRFLDGVELVLDRYRRRHPGRAGAARLSRQRRAELLRNAARECLALSRRGRAAGFALRALCLEPRSREALGLLARAAVGRGKHPGSSPDALRNP